MGGEWKLRWREVYFHSFKPYNWIFWKSVDFRTEYVNKCLFLLHNEKSRQIALTFKTNGFRSISCSAFSLKDSASLNHAKNYKRWKKRIFSNIYHEKNYLYCQEHTWSIERSNSWRLCTAVCSNLPRLMTILFKLL